MDITHFYMEKGQGEPLILLHGNGESCAYFEHQMDPFSARYHVYALDTRGHGKTPRGERPFTIRQFAEDLLGFSDGGNIAMVFAMRYPDRVGKLILNGANLDAEGVRPTVQIPIEIGYRIARAFAEKSGQARRNAELLGLMVNDPNVPAAELSKITAKALVMAGTRDMITAEHTRLIAESIPGAELAFLEGDHFIAAKQPEQFNQKVLEFLEK